MALPDGMPVAWYMRALGVTRQQRIDGPGLMWHLCASAAASSQRGFFYGSSPRVLKRLTTNLKHAMPSLQIAGTHSPPYRALTANEDKRVIELINASGAGLVLVALGCPKQELWMAQHRGKIRGVMVGVGAAFEFHAGTIRRAPTWMQEMALEWLFRLVHEPKRLWRRYFTSIPIFLFLVVKHLMKTCGRVKLQTPLRSR
jgi:N-acetylglucosaminyldiphosphoundecaprenol N-acetyl-beta-D-mannosaminyltransferase